MVRSPLRLVRGLADAAGRDRLRALAVGLACALGGAGSLGAGFWSATVLARPAHTGQGGALALQQDAAPASAAAAAGSGTTTSGTTGSAGRLVIRAMGVDAAIESVGLDEHKNMATPAAAEDVGWYRYGPAPGDRGDAVIDGHRDWTAGPAVFWKLDKLRPGDDILVELPDREVHFRVTRLTSVPYTAHPAGLFARTGPSRLSLITCSGPFDVLHQNYVDRLIVDADLVESQAT